MQYKKSHQKPAEPKSTELKEGATIGKVIEALPNTLFRVQFEDGSMQLSYLAGKMRINKIKVLIGDTVQVMVDPYGGRGRIIKRM
jgi:translation initiation factor IF-1